MRIFTEVGRVVLPHCTGVGKAILSMLTDQQVTGLLERTGMPARTDHTMTTVDAMLSALAQARELGYTLDDGEQERGVRCVAVPLIGLPFLAAISVSGPSSGSPWMTFPASPPSSKPSRRASAATTARLTAATRSSQSA